jgi:UTP--glucose-1-phosphate uridylyltransferase
MATLAPRADSFNARVRGSSHIDFKTATTGVAAKAMRNEISRLVGTVEDPATKKAFDTDMQAFFYLFTRYLSDVLRALILTGIASNLLPRTRSSLTTR